MKKWISLFFALLVCLSLPVSTQAAGFTVPDSVPVTAASAYIFNLDTGLPVVDKNSHERRDIASLTKMMTCLLLVETVPDLDGTLITAPTSVYVAPVTDYSASTADIRPGETVTARSLLYGMLLPSGNEAAAITAYYLGKENPENFYAMMNARAKELGCLDTNFTNPHGLLGMDNNNYSTAYDLALIAQACWQYEPIRTAASASSYDMPITNIHTNADNAQNPAAAYTIYNTNRMLLPTAPVYRSYIQGLKTGSTHAAGRTFAGVAANDKGETYVGVFLGTPWDPAPDGYAYSFHDAMNLFDWVFASFAVQPALDITVPITEIPVKLSSETDIAKLLPAQDMKTILPLEGGAGLLEHTFDVPEFVNAPVRAGDKLGTVTLRLQGEVIGTVDLLAAQDIERNALLNILYAIGEFFKGTYFRVVLILTGIYIVLYFSIMLWLRAKQRKRRLSMQRRAANLGTASREAGSGAHGAAQSRTPFTPPYTARQNTGTFSPPGMRSHSAGQANRATDAALGNGVVGAPRSAGSQRQPNAPYRADTGSGARQRSAPQASTPYRAGAGTRPRGTGQFDAPVTTGTHTRTGQFDASSAASARPRASTAQAQARYTAAATDPYKAAKPTSAPRKGGLFGRPPKKDPRG